MSKCEKLAYFKAMHKQCFI